MAVRYQSFGLKHMPSIFDAWQGCLGLGVVEGLLQHMRRFVPRLVSLGMTHLWHGFAMPNKSEQQGCSLKALAWLCHAKRDYMSLFGMALPCQISLNSKAVL